MRPVTLILASFTSVIFPSVRIVTMGVESGFNQTSGEFGGVFLCCDVAGGGEHAEHIAVRVAVERGVIQDANEAAVLVPAGRRIRICSSTRALSIAE